MLISIENHVTCDFQGGGSGPLPPLPGSAHADHLSNEPPLRDAPVPITIDMVKNAISKMKSGKAAGPSGIMVMIKVAGDTGATMICDLATAIIRDGKVPTDWEQSFIVCLYNGKGDALDRSNHLRLKLTEQAMKILEGHKTGGVY